MFSNRLQEVWDAKQEYDTGAEGSQARLERCQRDLKEVIDMGTDADVGLADWSEIR